MRRLCLISTTLLALSVCAPAHAQQLAAATFTNVVSTGAGPDAVVARLMTFDRNHDGVITRAELPERMQALLSRSEAGATGDAIDAAAVRRIALQPAPSAQFNGLQVGHYGFGDGFNFDTRLHINGAIDDLRLATDVRDKAKALARDVQASGADRAKAHLLATMRTILSQEQLSNFKESLDGAFVTVHAVKDGNTTIFGATPEEAAGRQPVEVLLRTNATPNLARVLDDYGLPSASLQRASEEIEQFNLNRTGRLSSIDREAILDSLQGLLDDQQRGDLRAALERRPLVKQGQIVSATVGGVSLRSAAPVEIADLLLRLQQ